LFGQVVEIMAYHSTIDCVKDLERHGHLVRVKDEVDPNLEMAAIQRRVYAAGGKAIYFEKVKGSPFPAVCNLFGSVERSRFIFRKTLSRSKDAIQIKADPMSALKAVWRYWHAPFTGLLSLPMRTWKPAVLECETTIDQLPWIKSWPKDGGPFITLPQVYSEDPDRPGVMRSNIGMYRVQMAGNEYEKNREVGIHYQIHRGIGVHHAAAVRRGEKLKVAIFVGGPPAHTFAAVMPLPEGLPEVVFAGMLAGRRFRYAKWQGWTVAADADFCILGTIDPSKTKPEGPFGDHLGYYSLAHEFPVLTVEKVFHRWNAVWPFTVVGRPPQEDTSFGAMIHEMTKPMVPVSLPGVKSMHAVDSAGVHPLLLAIGSERYVPYAKERSPQEILTQANAILGFNQASLAKYLMIAARQDDETLDCHNEMAFMAHVLERVRWDRDLHFQTKTTIDTLDYSGESLNSGSKLVIAAAGRPVRSLSASLPDGFTMPQADGLRAHSSKFIAPGILMVSVAPFTDYKTAAEQVPAFCAGLKLPDSIPLVVLVDDAEFAAASAPNFLWVTFTRSNPSHDIYGVDSFVEFKHWGCRGSLVIDARIKPHHAPPLVEDSNVTDHVEQRFDWIWKET
jgi:4-hydroxy-3-polyprenylbenzoate decarboxylase